MTVHAKAPTSELKVIGSIATPQCNVMVGNGGVFDIGAYAPDILSPTRDVALSPVTQRLQVACDAMTHLTFRAVDNEAGSESTAGDNHFGLSYNGSNKIGYYTLDLTHPTVDGKTSVVFSTDNPLFFSAGVFSYVYKSGYTMGWAVGMDKLATGKDFQADLTVRPSLAPAPVVGDVTHTVPLRGSITLDFHFAI
ncbi:DUF1120 domain-containing protein [Dyella sp. M7H15-1]|uniref:DUF1120 domain-containing protein n=1 Tax=Dyella sp. M7H15-1 TaxID=2501295 RepID=UPI0013E8C2F6|nr:DUF1120 domain-containing protein [Dyella sp. M7H15-1]